MHARQAARIAPRRASFAPKRRCPGGIADRQHPWLQDFITVQVRHRHLSRRIQEQIILHTEVRIILKLGKLAGAQHRRAFDQERRQNLHIAMFSRMHIQHEVEQSALQTSAQSTHDREACPRDLRPTLKIDDLQALPKLPVRQRGVQKIDGLAPGTHLHILLLASPLWHTGMGDIGKLEQQHMEVRFNLSDLNLHPLHIISYCLERRGEPPAHLFRYSRQSLAQHLFFLPGLRAQSIAACNQAAAHLGKCQHIFQRHLSPTLAQGFAYQISMLANKVKVKHRGFSSTDQNRAAALRAQYIIASHTRCLSKSTGTSVGTSSAFSGPLTYYAAGSIIDANVGASGKSILDAGSTLLWVEG